MSSVADDILMHYGTKRHSGRYPWGSGKDPYQRSEDFLARVEELQNRGLSEKDISAAIGVSTTELRLQMRLAKHERRTLLADRARSLREDGKTLTEIAAIMGYENDSSVRALLNQQTADNKNVAYATADALRKELETKAMIDVGKGVERELGVSPQKLEEALRILENEGYNVYGGRLPQATDPSKMTTMTVLTRPDVEHKYMYDHWGEVESVGDYIVDGERVRKVQPPTALDHNRVSIVYGDEGGLDKDGLIEIRRGVNDLSLGNSHYAQVRIMMDDGTYMKGMAIYADNLPDGVDIRFNTNKKSGTPREKVFKPVKDDPNDPFGAVIKAGGQSEYVGEDGDIHISPVNRLKEEGDWDKMDRNLSQQFLSKQPMKLINRQLDLSYADREAEYDEIMGLTNATLKKKMLRDFADDCDSAAVHLRASALPGQNTRVILPVPEMSDTEIFAPSYENGDRVALIRYPHGGTFEIPVLTVNNKQKNAVDAIGTDAFDAVGISKATADRLSGADFDGDQVVVIPLKNGVDVKSTPVLKDLEGFSTDKYEFPSDIADKISLVKKTALKNGKVASASQIYKETGARVITEKTKQKEMGIVSNLITDMTLQGATEDELARAVKHSMVVIDAEKHNLDYKRSERENGIEELKSIYQRHIDEDGTIKIGGAATLLSMRKQDVRINERQGSPRVDRETGEYVYKESGRTYVDPKTGKRVPATETVSLMSVTKDAHSLSTGTQQEEAYADYANKLKAMANKARLTSVTMKGTTRDPSAANRYRGEVTSLEEKLNKAILNAPRERKAQAIANSVIKAQVQAHPELKDSSNKKAYKKVAQNAINDARDRVGAKGKDSRITITDSEWEAIQAGAISDTKLAEIFSHCDQDALRDRAMPKASTSLSEAKVAKARSMQRSGYTIKEIANAIGISESTVKNHLDKAA